MKFLKVFLAALFVISLSRAIQINERGRHRLHRYEIEQLQSSQLDEDSHSRNDSTKAQSLAQLQGNITTPSFFSELEVLAMKAEGEGGLAFNKQPDNNIIYCERLNQFSSSYGQEEQALCTLCNSSRGIRLNGDNWKRDILMTDLEQITFTRAYYTLQSIFIDLPFAFALTGNNMCFVSVRLKGEYSLKYITSKLGGAIIDNKYLLPNQQDVVRPTFLALRYELDTMTRDIVNTKYLIKSYLPLEMKYDVPNYFNFTVLEQRVDTFIDVVTFSGYVTTYRKGLSMPFSINMRLKPSDLLLPKVRIIFEPFKDTMEVKTFYEVFNIPPAVYNNLVMPKGIETINTLPVDFVTVYYQTQESWQKGYPPTSMNINYRSPAFNFMPKISFQSVTGSLQVNFLQSRIEINIFMNGCTYIDSYKFYVNVQKLERNEVYHAYFKSQEGLLSLNFLENQIYSTFNVQQQDFWPEDDPTSLLLIKDRLQLPSKKLVLPSASVYWLPRLAQTYSGYISIYQVNDAFMNILMANLAGTTLQTTHLSFTYKSAFSAFERAFNLQKLEYFNELRSFDIQRFVLIFSNQDIDLNNWPNLKVINAFADESVWVEGATVKLTLRIKDSFTDLYSKAFSHVFSKLVGLTSSDEILLQGNLLQSKQVRLQSLLPEIQLSDQVLLKNARFVVSFNLTQKNSRVLEPVDTYIEGYLQLEVDPGQYLNFFTKIDATNEEWITIDGKMTGIYSGALGLQNLQISQARLHGQLGYDGKIRNMTLHGLGLFGKECLRVSAKSQHNQAIEQVLGHANQHSNNPEFTLQNADPSLKLELSQIVSKRDLLDYKNSSECFTGDIKLVLDLNNFKNSFLVGHVWVDSFAALLHFLVTDKQKLNDILQTLITPIQEIKFSNGIDISYSPYQPTLFKSIDIPHGFSFNGNLKILGITSYGFIEESSSSIDDEQHKQINIKCLLPSFTVGAENIQVFSLKDFYIPLTKDQQSRVTESAIQVLAKFDVESSYMPDIDQIEVSANVKVLEYITQVTLIMDDDSLTFTTSQNARPFNGIFEAEISASVQIDSAVFQNISVVPAVLNVTFQDSTDNYLALQDIVNSMLLNEWISLAHSTVEQYYRRSTNLLQHLNTLKIDLCNSLSCQQFTQCIEDPIVTCHSYKDVQTCIRKESTCQKYGMACETMKSSVPLGTGLKTDVCQAWGFQCDSSSENEICVEHAQVRDFNYCTDFNIDCVRGPVQDEYCLTKCINKDQEFEDLTVLAKNYALIADAAAQLFKPLSQLKQTQINSLNSLFTISAIELNADLVKPMRPSDYNVTVKYQMVNLIDQPRQVTMMNFDFLYIEASADRIAKAIREDVCSFYGISWSLANYLDIAIQNLQSLGSTLQVNMTQSQEITMDSIIERVTRLTENQALHLKALKEDKTARIQRAADKNSDRPTSLANIFVNNPNDVFKRAHNPSGLETVDYDLQRMNSINNQ